MKLKLSFIVLLTIAFSGAQAQFYMGPRVGVNLANMSTDAAGTTNAMKIGIAGGLTTKWTFAKNISLLGDVLYSQQGTESTLALAAPDGSIMSTAVTKSTYSFVSVPVMVNLGVPIKSAKRVPYRMGGSFATWNLSAGGYFGYALSVNNSTTSTIAGPPQVVTVTSGKVDSKGYNAVDFGIAVGTGFTFEMDPRNFLSIDARYMIGLGDAEPTDQVTSKHNVIGVSLSYVYRLTTRTIRR
jgi:hypothetical protein